MELFLSWLIKSFIVSGILYLYYHFALRNRQFHAYNRFYLLGTVVLSLIAPFMHFKWLEIRTPQNNSLGYFLNAVETPPAILRHTASFTAEKIIAVCFIVVSMVLLTVLIAKIIWVFTIKTKGKNTKMKGFNFIETEVKQAPFSFLNNLFWKKGMLTTGTNSEKIFTHELVHIKQGHTYDKLFCQLIACICWINPFYWLVQKELNIIHEFLADKKCIEQGDAESFASMLLYVHNNGRYLNPSHPFFNSSIKRRLTMITSSKNSRYSYVRRILALPVVLLLLIVLSVSVKAQADPKLNPGSVQINKVAIQKKASAKSSGDSTVDVKIDYLKTGGTPTTRHLKNIQFKAGVRDPSEQKSAGSEQSSSVDQNELLQKQHAEKLAAEKAALK